MKESDVGIQLFYLAINFEKKDSEPDSFFNNNNNKISEISIKSTCEDVSSF